MKKLVYKNSRAYKLHTTGVMSYARNFNNIVLPELNKYFDVTEEYTHGDFVLSLNDNIGFYNRPGSDKQKRMQKVVQILHTPDWEKIKGYINSDFNYKGVYRKLITHYQKLLTDFESQSIVDYGFIPMSIDTSTMFNNVIKTKKILWFGNVTNLKQDTYTKLKTLLDFDTLSKSRLNDGNLKTNEESLNIVSDYEYVFAVGQCALEALSMGCKVILIGKHFAGAITNSNYKEHWYMSNMNSEYKSIDLNYKSLLEEIEKAEILDDLKQFDMRNFTNNYIQEIINIDLQ